MSVTEKAGRTSCFPYKSLDEEEACVGVKIAGAPGNQSKQSVEHYIEIFVFTRKDLHLWTNQIPASLLHVLYILRICVLTLELLH